MLKKPLVIHPFLFAVFPVLSLFSCNLGKLPFSEIFLPAIILICLASLLCLVLGLIIGDKKKMGIIVSLFFLLFFSYEYMFGIICLIIDRITDPAVLSIWGTMFACGVYLTLRTRWNLHSVTVWLNIVAVFSIAIPIAKIGAYEVFHGATFQDNISTDSQIVAPDSAKSVKCPDIYYIILDGYARADILKEVYGYDNSEFLDYLTQRGFYVANKSKANYCQTLLSLASTLNLRYLDGLVNKVGVKSANKKPLTKMVKHSDVSKFLKLNGYVSVAFNSGMNVTNIENADIYMTPGWFLSEFQNTLINLTPLALGLNKLPQKSPFASHRCRLLFTFDRLANLTQKNSPIFVFAHIIAPHPPFVFGEHGEPIKSDKNFSFLDGSHLVKNAEDRVEYKKSYKKQLTFINKKIKETIDCIISKSPQPPIIILQSDHGPGSMLEWKYPDKTNLKERMSILNAYYLPNEGHKQLYQEITPVNTFRIIFNHYFGTKYELLKDESYFSNHSHPYKFLNVTDKINSEIHTQRRR